MHRLQRITGHLSGNASTSSLSSNNTSGSFTKKPIKVCVTGGAGNIAYSMLHFIAQGAMLGLDQPIELRLLDIAPAMDKVKGVIMELNDGAFPLLTSIVGTSDYKTAFDGVEIALLVGARPRGPGMVRADLLKANAAIFEGQGKALDKYASRDVKVLVVGNPCNTNALIAMNNAPSLNPKCFAAMTRLDENRAKSMLAGKTGVAVGSIKNIVIFGNHSKTMYPDVDHGYVSGAFSKSIRSIVGDDEFLDGAFIKTVQQRGSSIIKARGKSSAASAANAAVDTMRDWCLGTAEGIWSNMAVPSDGSYGIPKGMIFSFPLVFKNGDYSIVSDLKLSSFAKEKIQITLDELVGEKKAAGQ